MQDFATKVLWVYIVLLVVGGLIGFFKAGSQVSLVTSIAFAGLLMLTAIPNLLAPDTGRIIADILMAALFVVFGVRLSKTKRFMPSGMMLVITLVALVLRHI